MFSPFYLILFVFLLGFLVAMVQVGLLSLAFERLGLSTGSGFLLLGASLFGSAVNFPVARVQSESTEPVPVPPHLRGLLRQSRIPFTGETVIAVNLGGCLIPLAFSLYLLGTHDLPASQVLIATALVSLVAYAFSRPVPGLGIAMPVLIAPLAAALVALGTNAQQAPPLAYISGTLGVLIGADLLHMKDIRRLGTPIASIGGAGTFDGIFITGIVAVLLT